MIESALLYGIALPFLVSGVCLGIGWRLWSRQGAPLAGGEWSGAPAMALGCLAGSLVLWGWPGFPPKVAEGWLPFLATSGLVAGLCVSRFQRRKFACGVLLSMLAVGSALGPRRATWSMAESLFWHGALTVAVATLYGSIDLLLERRRGASMPLAMMTWCAGLVAALTMTGSLKYGQTAGLLTAALGAALVGAWRKPILSIAHGATAVIVPWNVALIICGQLYSDLTAGAALALVCAPATLWIAEAEPISRRPAWVGLVTRTVLMATMIAVALLLT